MQLCQRMMKLSRRSNDRELLSTTLLILFVLPATSGFGVSLCPPGGGEVGPPLVPQYTVIDNTGHRANPHAGILFDAIDIPGCCGVVTGFTLMVNGDTTSGACDSIYGGCLIDLIIWKNLDFSNPSYGYGATVHGIVHNVTVVTDPNWPSSPVPTTITLSYDEQIPIDTSTYYFIGWNCYDVMAVDYITNSSNGCAQSYVSCIDNGYILTTEAILSAGYPSSYLTEGNAYFDFFAASKPRFYAFQAIVDAGVPPTFVSAGTTMYIVDSTAANSTIATATATNPETLENLTYSKRSETPTNITCFNVDSATGAITTAQSLGPCVGQHNVTVEVSDGCMFALTTYTFIVWTPTTSVSTTTTTQATTPNLFETVGGQALLGTCIGLALVTIGTLIAICVVCCKKSAKSAAGQVASNGEPAEKAAYAYESKNDVNMTKWEPKEPIEGPKDEPVKKIAYQNEPNDDNYGTKWQSKERYLDTPRKPPAYDWT